jgi:CheY-like chemotaxis protein
VFLNLIINAAQAIPAGAAERNEIRLGSRWDPARQRIILEVADTGSGIEQRHLQHVFEPFFTTRRASGGTGLGLSICHRIITGFGGEIGVESELGKGTRFEIALPAAPVADEAPTPADGATTLRRARVLIIDDEPLVGAAARRAVGAEHEVLVATRAAEALERIRAGERYDVILCDLMMPEITGAELHGLLSASNVDQARRMVFMTGAAFTEESRRFLEEGGRAWLSKPFVVDEVRAALARVLAARS